jgi:hypothetical protein
MDEQQETRPELSPAQVMRAHALQAAMLEVLKENQPEIIRRARAKLAGMGIVVKDDDDGGAA